MTISSAIHDRHLLSFTYDGFPRVVFSFPCPMGAMKTGSFCIFSDEFMRSYE